MPTQRYKLTIAYRGTRYHGWQTQPALPTWKGEAPLEGQGIPTIQETIAPAMRYKIESEVRRPGTDKKDQ